MQIPLVDTIMEVKHVQDGFQRINQVHATLAQQLHDSVNATLAESKQIMPLIGSRW